MLEMGEVPKFALVIKATPKELIKSPTRKDVYKRQGQSGAEPDMGSPTLQLRQAAEQSNRRLGTGAQYYEKIGLEQLQQLVHRDALALVFLLIHDVTSCLLCFH